MNSRMSCALVRANCALVRVVMLSLLVLLAVSPLAARPNIAFEDRAIVVSGVTAGGLTAWLGCAHEERAYHLRIGHDLSGRTDDDSNGVVRLDFDRDVPRNSVWVVVDVANGAVDIAAPGGKQARRGEFAASVVRGPSSKLGALVSAANESLLLCYVRPGVGAWVQRVTDASDADADRQDDGNATMLLSQFTPLGQSGPPPADSANGDLLFGIDVETLQVFELRVVKTERP